MDPLKTALGKEVADLTVEEKTLIGANAEKLTAEEKVKFATVLETKDEGIDEVAIKELVTKNIQEALKDKANEISDQIISKMFAGVKEQRAKILEGKTISKDAKSDDVTREFMKAVFAGDTARAKALTTSTSGSSPDDAKAGLLIPEELRNEVLRIAELQYGLARREMLYLPFTGPGDTRKIPALGTSVSVFWTGEGVKKNSTQPKFNIVTQTLKKLAAIVPMTEEILEDSAINLTQLIGALFAEAVAKEEDLQFFAGDGTVWTGILNNGSVNTVYQTVGGIANLSADDLLKMIDETPTGALAGAKFYMNRTVLSAVRKLKTATTLDYIFQNPGQGLPATIWNYPYELSDAFPKAADVVDGSPYILFGNLKATCIFGDKQQLRVKLLEEATITDTDGQTTVNLAEQDMVALRVVERVGYVIGLPTGLTVLDSTQES